MSADEKDDECGKSKSTVSKLMDSIEELEREELALEERLMMRGRSRFSAVFHVFVICFFSCAFAAVWGWYADGDVDTAMRFLPFCTVFVVGAIAWSLVSCFCDIRGRSDERRLGQVYSEARRKAHVLRDEVDYDRTLQVLLRMDKHNPQQNTKQNRERELRKTVAAHAEHISPLGGIHHGVGAAVNSGDITGRLHDQDVTVKRLICARCHYPNGYLPEAEWNTIRFRCRSCGALNARAPPRTAAGSSPAPLNSDLRSDASSSQNEHCDSRPALSQSAQQ